MDCSHFCLPGVPDLWNSLMLSLVPTWIAESTEDRLENDA
jgi:hypothetical protein